MSENLEFRVETSKQLDALLNSVQIAQEKFKLYDQETTDHIFKACAIAANQHRVQLARLAVAEAGMGVVEDKTIKNHFSAEIVYNAYKDMKTCGFIQEDVAKGYALYAEPLGILAGVVPCTNPTSTTIFKALIALKTKNCIVFSPHPRTVQCTISAAKMMRDTAIAAGAPANCIGWISKASIDLCTQLMRHPKISMIVATGAGGLVKAAYSSGKPCIGGSSGNTPVIIDETADIPLAVNSVLTSKTFDNGLICASEQTIIALDCISEKLKEEFVRRGCLWIDKREDKKRLSNILFKEDGSLIPDAVGQTADKLLSMANIVKAPSDVRVILVKLNQIGPQETLSREKLCPVLGFITADTYDKALELALKSVQFGGLGHTSVLYTDMESSEFRTRLEKFGFLIPTGRALVCMPASQGAIGGLYNAKQCPSMSLGCGSWGGNSTAEGLQPKHLLNLKQVAQRRNPVSNFELPETICVGAKIWESAFETAVARIQDETSSLIIIHSASNSYSDECSKEFTETVIDYIITLCAERNISVTAFPLEKTRTDTDVADGHFILDVVSELKRYCTDILVAIGDEFVLNSSKLIKLAFEVPKCDWEIFGIRYISSQTRIAKFPEKGKRVKKFICIPFFSSLGCELSPFASLLETPVNDKLRRPMLTNLISTFFMPDVVIIDEALKKTSSINLFRETVCSCISDALESLVSICADANSREKSKRAFLILSDVLSKPWTEITAEIQQSCLEALVAVGVATARSLLGIGKSISTQLMTTFDIGCGTAKMLILCQVVSFNACEAPVKLANAPQYHRPKAKEEYASLVRATKSINIPQNCSNDACVDALLSFLNDLKLKLGVPANMRQMGVPEDFFLEGLEQMASNAFDDQFTMTNPR